MPDSEQTNVNTSILYFYPWGDAFLKALEVTGEGREFKRGEGLETGGEFQMKRGRHISETWTI